MRREVRRTGVFTRRALMAMGGQALVFGALATKLYQVQAVEGGRYATLANDNRISARMVAPPRGRLLDRFGVSLAGARVNWRALFVAENAVDARRTLDTFSKIVPLTETERARIDSSGNFKIANLTTNGAVYSNGTALTNTNPSDHRLKENIIPVPYGLAEINKLNPVSFNWKNDPKEKKSLSWGFIAQEVQPIMPELVTTFIGQDEEEYFGLETNGVYTTLVRAIQELSAELNEL